ncbi:MAG: HAD-IIB family hydrolase [Candidatus Eiseniibacteriota bacterium]
MASGTFHLHLYHLHGLFRARSIELGRDADTGGQTKYVLELATALSRHPEVAQVDVITRRIEDPRVSPDYARPIEHINKKARIIRIRFGGRRYRRKEALWPYLDELVDNSIRFIRSQGRIPSVLHAHYADAGYVATQLARFFGAPLIFTGHSLGRSKLSRLLDNGMSEEDAARRYRLPTRIRAEEETLRQADLVVASTRQERDEQYSVYENRPSRFAVLPPGIDIQTFRPYTRAPRDRQSRRTREALYHELDRFHMVRSKPLILALSRPDYRKNIPALVRAYGSDGDLRKMANLAIFAGIRKDLRQMPDNEREVLTTLLMLMDIYDLYGRMAIPKRHDFRTEVPELYRIAARSRGVFVNPALTEPFGLTLIEAAASGLPVVATNDGGPQEIIEKCRHGILVDPKDDAAIAESVKSIIGDKKRWQEYSQNGIEGVRRHYTWEAHTKCYIERLNELPAERRPFLVLNLNEVPIGLHLQSVAHLLVTDIDDTLTGDPDALAELCALLEHKRGELAFGIATGRSIASARQILSDLEVPAPDFIVSSVGAEIYMGNDTEPDRGWTAHISYRWQRDAIAAELEGTDGLELQEEETQRPFKLSYYIDPSKADLEEIEARLVAKKLRFNAILTSEMFLDFLPHRASKGRAIRYLAFKWDIPHQSILVCGGSGNDYEMLSGRLRGAIVANHTPELEPLRHTSRTNLHFSEREHAAGVIDGLHHHGFVDESDLTALQQPVGVGQ